jgi:carbamoyl-phosphate synthase large subunit
MRRILVTGAGGAGIYPLWDILKNKYKFFFADFDTTLIDPKIPSKLKIEIPLASNKRFLPVLKKIIKKNNIDLVVPTVDEEIIKISLSASISSMCFIPNRHFIKRTMDKLILIEELKKFNFQIPKTYLSSRNDIPFPKKYIIKPRFGRGSRYIHTITKYRQIKNYLGLYDFKSKDIIVQEFIKGTEFTIFVGMNKNEIPVKILPLKICHKKGITISGEVKNNIRVINFVKNFCKYFKTSNSFNIQLIISKKGVYPIEINPRISTTFFISLLDGFDPFETNNISKQKIEIGKKMIKLRRYWKNIIN